jgi:hypothetical protein
MRTVGAFFTSSQSILLLGSVVQSVMRMWRVTSLATAVWLVQCAPISRVDTDSDQLRALHEKVIQAHRQSNVDVLLEDESADYVVAGRGEVTHPTLDERRERLGSYLGRTTFHEYRDVADPLVRVSRDGTLGWVIVQVQARGLQATPERENESLEFVSAWIELYEKRDGRWFRVGNVSNFK